MRRTRGRAGDRLRAAAALVLTAAALAGATGCGEKEEPDLSTVEVTTETVPTTPTTPTAPATTPTAPAP